MLRSVTVVTVVLIATPFRALFTGKGYPFLHGPTLAFCFPFCIFFFSTLASKVVFGTSGQFLFGHGLEWCCWSSC